MTTRSSKAVPFLYLLGCAEEPLFLQFHAGMLKDVIHLLCIYSCIGSEFIRAIFPFTLLDVYSGLSMTWFAHNATDGILFWPVFWYCL